MTETTLPRQDIRVTALSRIPEAGWHMPAEWAPHERCWMAFPSTTAEWGADLPEVRRDIASLAKTIRRFEPVSVVVAPADIAVAQAMLGPEIDLQVMAVNDLWMRDTGPTFLVNGQGGLAAAVWRFNVWGEKNSGYRDDRNLAGRLTAARGIDAYPAPITTEGGALHVDGAGTLMVTETSVLNENRNPGLTKAEAEKIFKYWLGVGHVIWLPGCRTETVTDGHIDGFACFARPGIALAELPGNETAADGPEMRENYRALQLAKDAKGRALEIGLMHRPAEVASRSDTFCDCYINFYVANGGIVMPGFGIPEADRRAAETVAKAFPGRQVAQISIKAIAEGGGGIHCSTQQQPVGSI